MLRAAETGHYPPRSSPLEARFKQETCDDFHQGRFRHCRARARGAASANAHDYVKMGPEIGQTNQWDVRLAAPFSREEFDRFTQ